MTTCTPLGLVYPDGGDRPCDVAPVTCDFVNGVESYLDQLDALVQRTDTSNPMAWIATTVPLQVLIGGGTYVAAFDTVVVDTANMVDLSALSGITITRDGIYALGYYVEGTNSQVNPTMSALTNIGSPNLTISIGGLGQLPAFTQPMLANGSLVTASPVGFFDLMEGDAVNLNLSSGGTLGDSYTATNMVLYAVWLGDLA